MRLKVKPITCIELVELVTDYLEGELTRAQRRRVERHLAACDGCSAYVEQLRVTVRLTGRLRERDLDPRMRDRMLAAFRDFQRDV